MKLYHYVPLKNTVLANGLLSVSRCPEKLQTYAKRAETNNPTDIVKWLESCFPGRSRSISCLTEPIQWQNNDPVLRELVEQSELFSFELDDLLKNHLVESVWLKKSSNAHGKNEVFEKITSDKIDITPLNWKKVDCSKGLIYGIVRHYLIVLKNGVIPPEYLKKE